MWWVMSICCCRRACWYLSCNKFYPVLLVPRRSFGHIWGLTSCSLLLSISLNSIILGTYSWLVVCLSLIRRTYFCNKYDKNSSSKSSRNSWGSSDDPVQVFTWLTFLYFPPPILHSQILHSCKLYLHIFSTINLYIINLLFFWQILNYWQGSYFYNCRTYIGDILDISVEMETSLYDFFEKMGYAFF